MPRKPKPTGQHVAIYVRVSSSTQDTRSQEPDLKRWASTHDTPVVWYRDVASGSKMERPGWDRLMQAVRAGEVSEVACWRLDRLGRTAVGLTQLFAELVERGVNLVSIKDGLDLGTSAGRLMAHVLASVAQYEREVRAERQRAGIDAAKVAGVRFGRPAVGKGNGTRTKVTTEQEGTVRRLASEGQSKAAIARATGLSRPTVYAILGDGQS